MILSLLAVAVFTLPSYGNSFSPCPGSVSVSRFKFLVLPPQGGPPLPVNSINSIDRGDKLEYLPVDLPASFKGKAKVAVLLAPSSADASGHIEVLPAKPADTLAEWKAPMRAAVVGLVFGPRGLDIRKINSLVQKNPGLVFKLTDYVQQTSKVEALVQTLSKYDQSAPGSTDLKSMLSQFSSQYGVALPKLSPAMSYDQQAVELLHAVLPAFSPTDPLTRPTLAQQSSGLAASVATFFLGPQALLAAGGAGLFEELHSTLFPRAEFRSAFAEPVPSKGMNLCTSPGQTPSKGRVRLAYLWTLAIPDAGPPSVSLAKPARVPTGWKSSVEVTCASISQLKLLSRARDWRLVSRAKDVAIPVTVHVGPAVDSLSLDLTHAKLPAGQYHLAAKWDWTTLNVRGTIDLLNFADYSSVKLSPASEDRLIAGAGTIPVVLHGADFEFLPNLSLLDAKTLKPAPTQVWYSLAPADRAGLSQEITANIDSSSLQPGSYFLRLQQLNGQTHDVAILIHPPNPVLAQLPLRVNLGETQQPVTLRGTGLGRIVKITSDGASWTLLPLLSGAAQREATVALGPQAKKGELLAAKVFVAGIQAPLEMPGVLEIVGPRPRIVSIKNSFAAETSVALRNGEIPSASAVSFAIAAQNIGPRTSLHLACDITANTKHDLTLAPGQREGTNELDFAGASTLFLSLSPGDVGRPGCLLMATLSNAETGASDPHPLGRIVRLPQIEKFTLTDESLGNSLYAGALTGEDLQAIEKTGWNSTTGAHVQGIPTPVAGDPLRQTLKIAMPWPPPSPQAPLYIWLNGETRGRITTAKYQ